MNAYGHKLGAWGPGFVQEELGVVCYERSPLEVWKKGIGLALFRKHGNLARDAQKE